MTAPGRFREVGDLWARLRKTKPLDLETVSEIRRPRAEKRKAAPASTRCSRFADSLKKSNLVLIQQLRRAAV